MKLKKTTGQKVGAASKRIALKAKSARGGARPGSGPKPAEPKVRRSVGLSARQWAIFDGLGGNEWLRGELDAIPPASPESL